MRILIAASEAVPFVKTGGLADVAGALLKEYQKLGEEAFLLLPLYSAVAANFELSDTGGRVSIPLGDEVFEGRIFSCGSDVLFIGCDAFFQRTELYGTREGDYADNLKRFVFFDRAILETCQALGLKPDVIHCNDWHTGLVPVYLRTLYRNDFFCRTASLMTIHNLGYQGLFDASGFGLTGLAPEWFNPEGLEFCGRINFLKAGIIASDIITTVSDAYAREILTPESGFGLEGVLKKRADRIYGVLNGLDTEHWDPANDICIPARYNTDDISGKASCKKELLRECFSGAEDIDSPLVAFVGRLSEQKGIDILAGAAADIVSAGARLVILGKGDVHFESLVLNLAKTFPGAVSAQISFDEALGRRIYAGSDIFCMPSRYEPCGTGQLIAMRYGAVPAARRTGGLAETITDCEKDGAAGAGFLFETSDASALRDCLRRAFAVYRDKAAWKKIICNGMKKDFSWQGSARRYLGLYREALNHKEGGH